MKLKKLKEIAASIIAYIVMIGFWGWITYVSMKARLHKMSKCFLSGLVITWMSLIFNIIYTGLLGWNFTPVSDLEALLDSITFGLSMLACVLLWVGLFKIVRIFY